MCLFPPLTLSSPHGDRKVATSSPDSALTAAGREAVSFNICVGEIPGRTA